jgi:tRNA (adenine57-N1/adenine58-N1)-methyltransferase catalytic subunit
MRPTLLQRPLRAQIRRIADASVFKPGDHVLLRPAKDREASPIFCRALKPKGRTDTHKGSIHHDDIIGKRSRDIVVTKFKEAKDGGREYRVLPVRLEEYVRLTKRIVTPLYPQDAQLIVGLLDLHVDTPRWGEDAANNPKLEILEAGTGHGALTLYLSRAIHAGNPPIPFQSEMDGDEDHAALQQWKANRRAIIHTIELNRNYSEHAEKIVKGFRHGMYYHNVDFHIGSVSQWVTSALEQRGGDPFLSHAFLDLPGAEQHIEPVAAALRTDGCVIVFNPSITQIMEAVTKIREEKLALELGQVIELGVNGGTGGREWDVRAVRPRSSLKQAAKKVALEVDVDSGDGSVSGEAITEAEDSAVELDQDGAQQEAVAIPSPDKVDWKMVCRPKVGEAVVGGGFLGVFRKQRRKPARDVEMECRKR